MRFYNFMVRMGLPRSYIGQILLVSFLGVHVPLIGLVAFAVFFGPLPLSQTWPFLVATLVATGLGTGLTLAANYALLAPMRAASLAMRRYLSDKTVMSLPVNRQDEAGQLMTDVQEGITRLDHALDAAHAAHDDLSERHKSTFAVLSEMSHELRTPLNHIIGFSELMQHERLKVLGADRRQSSGYADIINESGSSLLKLVETILELSQIEADRVELESERLDLREMANNVFGLAHHHIGERDVRLVMNGGPSDAMVVGDPRALKQALLQATMVSIDTAGDHGVVTVAVAARGDTVSYRVEDTGAPFDRDDVPAPLRSGFDFSDAPSGFDSASRTGLLLAVVHALVSRQGGSLTLTNRGGSETGKAIEIRIPAASGAAAAHRATATAA